MNLKLYVVKKHKSFFLNIEYFDILKEQTKQNHKNP